MEQLVKLLLQKGLKLAVAESCTGGLLAGAVTSVSGCSACFEMGIVTYSNEAKQALLGVRAQTLAAVGAVSAQTAEEMADGMKRISGADIALSVTGIAGPGGGTPEKPVGLVYIGLASKDGVQSARHHFIGTREQVRQQAVEQAAAMAMDYLCNVSLA